MSQDALDKVGGGKFSKKDRQEYAKKMIAAEETKALTDKKTVQATAKKYQEHIAAERKRLGLTVKVDNHGCCKTCFRWQCICEVKNERD